MERWCYFAGSVKNIDIYFVKLNSRSDYVFRLDVARTREYDIREIVSLLADNSRDPVFLGYPYGLIEADRFARVTNREKEGLFMELVVRLKSDYKRIKPYLNSLNSHGILDSIS